MTLRLSTRVSIRWYDEPPSEPTTTIVLSVGSYFVDLRVNKIDDSIDWAFAGTREILSQSPLRCRWYHVIDSRNVFDPDEGSFEKLPNGDDLETGCMPCPERNNEITPYEEVWRALPLPAGLERGWVLQGKHGNATSFLGRVGGIFVAMRQRTDGSFAVSKEELVSDVGQPQQWVGQYRSGGHDLPSLERLGVAEFDGESMWKIDDQVEIEGQGYIVRAIESL
ncbi:hypothetical protein GQ53DRAFT_837472 [Thozetella sp. PMI_491]|nr:hypothetical protein GQ53DRAFT_837472 [Thozetella sp. PMI_491]